MTATSSATTTSTTTLATTTLAHVKCSRPGGPHGDAVRGTREE
jgi:hypothetical protein